MGAAGLLESRRRLLNYLTLLALPGVGRLTLGRRMEDSGRGWAWLDQAPEALLGQLRGSLVPDTSGLLRAVETALHQRTRMEGLGITPLFRGSPPYPPCLERLKDPPRLLFTLGPPPDGRAVAVVGTRKPTEWGLAAARRQAVALAKAGVPVLNGLAVGVDRAALASALEAGAPCVGVLAAGLDVETQAGNAELSGRILSLGGTLVSEYPPGTQAHKGSFIERDRIQAGLSAAVLVVESGLEGGTLHTAAAASEAGIPLYAFFPRDSMDRARRDPAGLPSTLRGNWELIRSGTAVPILSPEALLKRIAAPR